MNLNLLPRLCLSAICSLLLVASSRASCRVPEAAFAAPALRAFSIRAGFLPVVSGRPELLRCRHIRTAGLSSLCGGWLPAADVPLPRAVDAHGALQTGPYLDWRKTVPLLGLFLLWVATLHWVDVDAGALRLNRQQWNGTLFGCGLAGLVLFFSIPGYWAGFVLLALSYAVPVSWYITMRNDRVSEARRILTVGHLLRLPQDVVQRAGRLLSREAKTAGGPPVVLFVKSITGGGEDLLPQTAALSRGQRAIRELLYDAVQRNATDIHLTPTGEDYAVRLRIDGELRSVAPFDRSLGTAVVNIFKVLSALDITDRRKSQDGSFGAEIEGRRIDFRVATQGTQLGEKLSLRILDPSDALSTLASLGMRRVLQERIRDLLTRQHGLFLVAGPTGAGKTTTLYAALRTLDATKKNIITVEDPIEYRLPGIHQIEVNTKAGQTFAETLKHLLRQDPDVLVVGEIRDAETAAIACEAANTGHVVLSTIHAPCAVEALLRLRELGVEAGTLAAALTGILAQRLVRRLCPDCRVAWQPDTQTLTELGLPPGKVSRLYRPPEKTENVEARCSLCGGTGYSGRTGVFEYLAVTPRIRELIGETASVELILAEARENGMLFLKEEGLGLVARGITSLEELRSLGGVTG